MPWLPAWLFGSDQPEHARAFDYVGPRLIALGEVPRLDEKKRIVPDEWVIPVRHSMIRYLTRQNLAWSGIHRDPSLGAHAPL